VGAEEAVFDLLYANSISSAIVGSSDRLRLFDCDRR
jgi:hypothetical protein